MAENHNYFVGNSRLLTHNALGGKCLEFAKQVRSRQGGKIITVQNPNKVGYVIKPKEIYKDYVDDFWGYHSVHVDKKGMVLDKWSEFGKKRIPLSDWKNFWDDGYHEFVFEP